MKISTVLDHIDSGHMALPEFQRGYVGIVTRCAACSSALPTASGRRLASRSPPAQNGHHRGDDHLAAGVVKLLLDGQQRMTSLYGGSSPDTLTAFSGAPPPTGPDESFEGGSGG